MKIISFLYFLFLPSILVLNCSKSPQITWHDEDGYRWAELPIPKDGQTGFALLSESKTGIRNVNSLTQEQIKQNRHLLNGSGVTIGDIDNDGLSDIFFSQLNGPNVLYKNLGNFSFKNITDEAGVAAENQFSTGATFFDGDGDNDLDLIVTSLGGPNAYFINDGNGKFSDNSKKSGLTSHSGATSIAIADIDGDNDLDVYITNYKLQSIRDIYPLHERTIEKTTAKVGEDYIVLPEFENHYTVEVKNNTLMRFEYAEPDMLFLNNGQGLFQKVAMDGGRFLDENDDPVPKDQDWGLSVRFQDMDDDSDPDLYICNDFESPDRIWINDGTGFFRPIDKLAIRTTSASSMGIDFTDVNRDGKIDFFLTEMLSREHKRRKTQMGVMTVTPVSIGEIDNRPQVMRNTMFLNRGDFTFTEIAQYSGIQASEWSWGSNFFDIDLDGFEDLIIVTGHFYDAMDSDTRFSLKTMPDQIYNQLQSEIFAYPTLETANFIFHNRGDLTFEETSKEWGFTENDISHGMATGDLDNDGDLDVVVNRLNKPPAIYRNDTTAPRIAVRLRGEAPNTQAIGAKITLLGGPTFQSKEVICGGTYLSGSDQLYVFAAGDEKNGFTLEVTWRNGVKTVVENVQTNCIYEISESTVKNSVSVNSESFAKSNLFFEDVSNKINHIHHEDPYDDFERQPLLPNRLSQLGPGISWFDINNDGKEDLLVPSGKGGKASYFLNNGDGSFKEMNFQSSNSAMDQTAIVSSHNENGVSTILVANSNIETNTNEKSSIDLLLLKNGNLIKRENISTSLSGISSISLADYDNDSDLDLFVGGRANPGRYPEPPISLFYKYENDRFVPDSQNSKSIDQIGMVSSSVFSDIDGDGDPDLILAIEWGPLTIFENLNGVFIDATDKFGLSNYLGWWNGVTTGDLDSDGKLDIIATNWGLNSKYNLYAGHDLNIYYDDFDHNGILDIIEAHTDPLSDKLYPERGLSCMSNAMPFVKTRNPTFEKFGEANLEEVIGPRLADANKLTANHLEHTLFLNRGNNFKVTPLHSYAQFAPAFYAGISDFDGDGNEDVFISQNFFASQIETNRSDGGRGLWLKGDGKGNLTPIPGHKTGIKVYGDQRGAALCDYDQDGRVDLAVSQNGAQTKLYHNIGGKPGLRVQLNGPNNNPQSIGAKIRLVYEDGLGPVREIQAGSGYWSQNSAVQVMGLEKQPKGIWVQWPNGTITEKGIPSNLNKISIDFKD